MGMLALFAWPFVTLAMALRLYWPVALLIGIVGGHLLLPPRLGVNLPLLPALDKFTIPVITLVLLALLLRPGEARGFAVQPDGPPALRGWLPRNSTSLVLLAALVVGALLTAQTNGDRLVDGSVVRPGLSLYDGFALIVAASGPILAYLLGRKYLATAEMHRLFLVVLALAMLLYSLPTLYEVRMSPQLNRMVYGFFPHDWRQHIRGGGFRPVVFTRHGLELGILLCMGILAAFGAWRVSSGPKRTLYFLAGLWLLGTLVLSKSLGALLIALAMLPVILFLGLRLQLLAAAGIAAAVLLYPMMRGADLVPTRQVVSMVEQFDRGRASSFQFRLDNEDALLDRANERPLFGWGGYRRNRVFDERRGDTTVTDGTWIITIGQGGWVGYVARFGLLTMPVILLAMRQRRFGITQATAALCVVLVANLVDLIPNAGVTAITWLMAGALMGRLELGASTETGTTPETTRQASVAATAVAAAHGPAGRAAASADRRRDIPYTRQETFHQRIRVPRKQQ